MKKHPVDDLFKSKLSDWEKKPSSSAWEKIQKESKTKPKVIVWPWYAAASVIITLMAGYAVWNYNGNALMPENNKKTLAATDKKEQAAPIIEQVEKDNADEEIAVSQIKPEIRISKKQLKQLQQQEPAIPQQPEIIESEVAIKELEPVKSSVNDVSGKIARNEQPEIKPLSIETISNQAESIENEPSRTIVIAVETQSNEEDKPRNSKLSRVFRQLKNARAGEHVDWEEVGFNPKSLVAKVDDRLRNGEEKVSEKYHNLKEKTKL